jgi:hypothetical protein
VGPTGQRLREELFIFVILAESLINPRKMQKNPKNANQILLGF